VQFLIDHATSALFDDEVVGRICPDCRDRMRYSRRSIPEERFPSAAGRNTPPSPGRPPSVEGPYYWVRLLSGLVIIGGCLGSWWTVFMGYHGTTHQFYYNPLYGVNSDRGYFLAWPLMLPCGILALAGGLMLILKGGKMGLSGGIVVLLGIAIFTILKEIPVGLTVELPGPLGDIYHVSIKSLGDTWFLYHGDTISFTYLLTYGYFMALGGVLLGVIATVKQAPAKFGKVLREIRFKLTDVVRDG